MPEATPKTLNLFLAAVLACGLMPSAAFAAPAAAGDATEATLSEAADANASEGGLPDASGGEQADASDAPPADDPAPSAGSDGAAAAVGAEALEAADPDAGIQAAASLSVDVATTELVCGKPVTLTASVLNGSGDYRYHFGALMRYTDGLWTIVYDTTRPGDPEGQYTTKNTFEFEFVSPGSYWINVNVMDMGSSPIQTARNSFRFTIPGGDPAWPSVEEKVEQIHAEMLAAGITGEYAQALWLHDRLIDMTEYDHSYKYACADGVLLRGIGTCESYHQAYMMLLKRAGIACERAVDTKVDMHVWTKVRIDGVWCHVDTTWDDNANLLPGTKQDMRHYLFGVDDRIIKLVHEGYEAGSPACTSLERNHFVRSGAIKQFSQPLHASIQAHLDAGETSFSLTVPYASWPAGYKDVIYNIVAYDLTASAWSVAGRDASVSASYANDVLSFTADLGTEIELVVSDDEMTVEVIGRGGAFARASTTDVRFPAWSVAGGQDDIVWYGATRTAAGEWRTTVRIPDHRTAGDYVVHAYGSVGGKQVMLASASFRIARPTATLEIVEQTPEQLRNGTFSVRLSGMSSPSGIRAGSVRMPTWSEANGQDDIVWYDAHDNGDGTWSVEAPCVAANREPGRYVVHAYATAGNGIEACVATVSGEVSLSAVRMEAVVATDETGIVVSASGGLFNAATSVQFPTWSAKGGQDDIVWYSASRATVDGVRTWTARIPIASHRTAGDYAVHAYGIIGGASRFLGSASAHVTEPSARVAIVPQTAAQKDAGTFTVRVSDVSSPSGIRSMQAPTWSNAGGQDDIVWYGMGAGADGTWTVEVPCVAANREPGLYLAHVYGTAGNGIEACLATTSATVEASAAKIVVDVSADERYADVTAHGGLFNAAASVQFPTWSAKGGQDDIVWYSATRTTVDGVRAWSARIPIANHRTAGDYAVHAYGIIGGASRFLGSASFRIAQPTATVEVLPQTAVQLKTGEFTVRMSDVASPSGIDRGSVRFPTWSEKGGQDDIVWYAATAHDDGTWTMTTRCIAANREPGRYLVHAYATAGNGIETLFGTAAAEVGIEAPAFEVSVAPDGRSVTVKATGGCFALAERVQFPTWSNANGQDDIVWYEGVRIADGYQIVFDAARHAPADDIIVHAYATVSGSSRFAGSTSFDATIPSARLTSM